MVGQIRLSCKSSMLMIFSFKLAICWLDFSIPIGKTQETMNNVISSTQKAVYRIYLTFLDCLAIMTIVNRETPLSKIFVKTNESLPQMQSLEDFKLKEVSATYYPADCHPVLTRLFNKKVVYAIVTKAKKVSAYRLFICTTHPSAIALDEDFIENQTVAAYGKAEELLLPLTIYSLRWKIAVCYYEQKKFWGFEEYMLRSQKGIKMLINLLGILYAVMKILPYKGEKFLEL